MNPDPGIFENKVPRFFGILVLHRIQCLQSLLFVFCRQLVGLFCAPRTFLSDSNFCSADPDRFYHLPVNEDHEEQRKISAVDLLTNLIKEKTTSLILIGRLSKLKFLISLYDTVTLWDWIGLNGNLDLHIPWFAELAELPGQGLRHLGDDRLVGHAEDSKNWKYFVWNKSREEKILHGKRLVNW